MLLKIAVTTVIACLSIHAMMASIVNTQDPTLLASTKRWAERWIWIHLVGMIVGIALVWAL